MTILITGATGNIGRRLVDELLERDIAVLAVSARNARDTGSASELHHRAVEEIVTSRTDQWTILRPGNLATNLLSWSFAIRSGYGVRVPYPTSSQVLIHEADVAAAAAIALTASGHSGRIYELTGPASLTKIEQLSAIAAAIGRAVPLVEVTPDEFRGDVSRFIPDDIIDMLL